MSTTEETTEQNIDAAETLREVDELYQAGQYLTAYQAGSALGPLTSWPGTRGRLLAGRLATNIGSHRMGQALVRLAWRNDKQDLYAGYFNALAVFRVWGPLRTWKLLKKLGDYSEASEPLRADWHGLCAHVLAMLRDHQRAEHHEKEALRLAPDRPWTWVQRSAILALGDRPEEALEATRKAMELRPFYRPAVQSLAAALLDLGRDDEALALLTEASTRLECGDVIALLAAVQTELRRYEEARDSYERLAPYYPLMDREKHLRDWLTARRSDAAYFCGDFATAAALADEVKESENYKAFAARLRESTDGKRLILNVGFVRQDRETCAPATLAAISNYWQSPVDHEEIVRKICYDGTPGHHERHWAEEQGFLVREFRVTWESVTALLDQGMPLTLTTVSPGNAHLQAIIGYDDRRRTLVVRDPSVRTYAEYDADELLKQFRATGPRGMVMAPADKAAALAAIELPEAEIYDKLHRVNRALAAHDRPAAQAAYDELRAQHPEHPLTLRSGWALTGYDSDISGGLACVESLLAAFPDDVNILMSKLSIFRELGRREERKEMLQALCAKKDCHPLILGELAVELSEDARSSAAAEQLLRRVVRFRPLEGRWYGMWGEILWGRQERGEALELYRFAACLDDKNEGPSSGYFMASRHLRRMDEALAFLRERFARLGALSSQPARTLVLALDSQNQHDALFATMDEALRLRPDDPELLLFAADFHARYGRYDEGDALLARAKGKCHPALWLRQAARMATYRGQPREALAFWQEALADQPLDGEAQTEVARLLTDLEGRPAAIASLRASLEQFPHHYRLRRLLVEWLFEESPAVQEAEVRELLARHENDAGAHRELAIVLLNQGRVDEALASAETACHLEPANPVVHWIFGRVRQCQGRIDEARQAMRESIRHSVDYQFAIEGLMSLCDAKAEREEELRFVRDELERQIIFGDGLLTFREHAAHTWGPQATLELLQEALAARGDLWHAHSAVIRQLGAVEQWDAALAAAREAVRRFPLLPRIWFDLAATCRGSGDAAGEIEALEKALEINPAWGEASCTLAEAHQRQGDTQQARQLLERALVHEPQSARIHATLADLLWELEDKEAAVALMKRAAELVPENDWIWKRLREWLTGMDRFDELLELVRKAVEVRPHSVPLWMILSEMYGSANRFGEAIEALDRAVALDPRHVDAHSLRAYYLSQEGRWDEALAACKPPALADDPPLVLRSREAHLIWQCGDRDEAQALMRAVVAEDPEYYWAWTRLADWYDELGDAEKYLEAAQQMTRIAPKYGQSHGYEGHARLKSGDRAGAKASFKEALELLPDYRFASDMLFDIQCEDGEVADAEATLTAASPHLDPVTLLAWRGCLDVARNDRVAALATLKELGTQKLPDNLALEKVVGALVRTKHSKSVLDCLEQLLELPECDLNVAAVWTNLCVYQTDWLYVYRWFKRMKRIRSKGGVWHAAARYFLSIMHDTPYSRIDAMPSQALECYVFIWRNKRYLRADPLTWSITGKVLLWMREVHATVRWMKDWKSRTGLQPQHLLPLAEALWLLRRIEKAQELSQSASNLEYDSATTAHHFLLALISFRNGEYAEAEKKLSQLNMSQASESYRQLQQLLCNGFFASKRSGANWKVSLLTLKQVAKSLDPNRHNPLIFRCVALMCRRRLAIDHKHKIWAAWYRVRGIFLPWF